MKAPGHEMILASAGSGKTYTLTNRYVRLLALGVPPERIVALTFTRKAAGEFFDKILGKLAQAADDPDKAAELAGELHTPGIGAVGFLALLRQVVESMPRLTLGTFDSFFARIVRAFPLELGLGGDFELLEESAGVSARRRAMRVVFDEVGRDADGSREEFIEAFKRSTFGAEEKRLSSLLDEFVEKHHHILLEAPDRNAWGNPERIWKNGYPWSAGVELQEAVNSLAAIVRTMKDLGDGQRERFDKFCEAIRDWSPGGTLPPPINYLVANTLKAWPNVLSGTAEITIDRKKLTFDGSACQALRAVVTAIIHEELQRRLEMTAGIFAILDRYERVYDRLVRRNGRLTFADIERILSPSTGAPILAQDASEETAAAEHQMRRLLIDWRLDGRFDHWLLDEFQDTSFGQWSALQNLVDEVIQDTSGQRSFFFVGDVKQAIYGWRGGDSRLFREISQRYNQGGAEVIRETPLDKSYRSAMPILDMVNTVFGNAEALKNLFPKRAAERWNGEWRTHTTAHPRMPGHAAWLAPHDEADALATVVRLIHAIDPIRRGLSVGVLTRKNETATRIADHLRREGGIPAMAESDLLVCIDNPVTVALLALFQAAAHPGDTMAWQHVQATPLRNVLEKAGLNHLEKLSLHMLRQVHAGGFEQAIERWWQRLEDHLDPADEFTRTRGAQMKEAARLFDDTGSRDFDEFGEFMKRHSLRDSNAAGVVRVMTIHKSKGLGFDLVILPELEGNKLAVSPEGLSVHRTPDRTVQWVLDLPGKLFYENDPVLAAHADELAADTCYDQLALLYVALTRARQGLYAIAPPPQKNSTSANFIALLSRTLDPEKSPLAIGDDTFEALYTTGDPAWFAAAQRPPVADQAPTAIEPLPDAPGLRITRFNARRPSAGKSFPISGRSLFAETEQAAVRHGSAVHQALALVEWWDDDNAVAWRTAAQQAGIPETAIREAQSCLQHPGFAEVFRRPAASRSEAWRERKFEVILDADWITGVFDRVVIHRDADGRIAAADIVDFKTDRIDDSETSWREAAARYRGQLALYRQAAARLTGLPASKITTTILLTHPIGPDHRHAPPQRLDPA